MTERLIEYSHEGTTLEAYMAWDETRPGPLPGVLISHAWGGREEFECNKARMLADLGYCAFALDLYGKGVRGSGPEENEQLMGPFIEDRAMLQSRLTTSLQTFADQPEVDATRIAAIGFCFGGLCVLDLARIGAAIQGVVSLHGLFMPPGNTTGNRISAKVLALHGHDDPMVPVDMVNALAQELTEAGADWQIHAYGQTRHAFTNPAANDPDNGVLYNPVAERRALMATADFLNEVLGSD